MYFNYDGISVYYLRQGTGRNLLLLHGWGADSRVFADIINHYKGRFCVTAIDFPPFGMSGELKRDYNVSDYKNIVIALLNYLSIDKTDIICHSFGGRVIIKMAAENPERINKIIFCGSAGIPRKKTLKNHIKKLHYKLSKFLVKLNILKEADLKNFFSSDYNALPDNMKKTFVNIINEDLTKYIKNIRLPALLIWGEKDNETPIYAAKLFKKYIKGSTLNILKGCGHYSFLDNNKGFTNLTDFFLTV